MDWPNGLHLCQKLGRNLTVYVGGIRFLKPISIGEVIKINAYVIYTGNTSINIAADVYSWNFSQKEFEKKTYCVIVFVSVDENGKPIPVKKWELHTAKEITLAEYAKKLVSLREQINREMKPFFEN